MRPPPGFSHVQPLPQCQLSTRLPKPAATPQHQWHLPAPLVVGLEHLCHPYGQPRLLGEGGMGKVELMHDARTRAWLAIKSPLLRGSQVLPRTAAIVEREHAVNADFMSGGLHPHVVRYLGPVSDQGQLNGSLAFEYLPGGCLSENLEYASPRKLCISWAHCTEGSAVWEASAPYGLCCSTSSLWLASAAACINSQWS